jgi:predicted permease
LLLALIGGGAGLLLAVWGVDSLKAFIPNNLLPDRAEISFDTRVLLFTLATAVITGLVFGLAPAIQATRVDVNTSLKESSGKGVAASKGRLRSALVVIEMALAMVLLVGAALTIRTFANLRGVEPGFDPQKVLTFSMLLSGQKYDTTARLTELTYRARERLQSLPGVEAVATTSKLPLYHFLNLPVEFDGQPGLIKAVEWQAVSPDYFRVMKIALKQGRDFADTDADNSAGVAIVNEAFVARYYPDLDPLAQHVTVARVMKPEYAGPAPLAIIGVVRDVKQFSLQKAAPPMMFVPTTQVPTALMRALKLDTNFVVRTTGNPLALSNTVKQEMREVESSQPILDVRSMEQVMSQSIAPQQFNMLLLGLFAAIGLILAGIGIYGVISYAITQRTHEIGIRMALGARPQDVLRLVLSQGLILSLIGVGLGIGGAFALTRLMSSLLFGVSTTDPLTFTVTALALIGVALGACFVPARRATRVDPMVALRYE